MAIVKKYRKLAPQLYMEVELTLYRFRHDLTPNAVAPFLKPLNKIKIGMFYKCSKVMLSINKQIN